jgi:glutamate-1-semialdehyde 2,1-aminomutase
LPVGVVCGKSRFMRRYKDSRPMDICFARGTFNSHPHVMATMNEFLRYIDEPEVRAGYERLDALWNRRAHQLNQRSSGPWACSIGSIHWPRRRNIGAM